MDLPLLFSSDAWVAQVHLSPALQQHWLRTVYCLHFHYNCIPVQENPITLLLIASKFDVDVAGMSFWRTLPHCCAQNSLTNKPRRVNSHPINTIYIIWRV
jgi:hypothetical protein